jgi:hypothetical protein
VVKVVSLLKHTVRSIDTVRKGLLGLGECHVVTLDGLNRIIVLIVVVAAGQHVVDFDAHVFGSEMLSVCLLVLELKIKGAVDVVLLLWM